VITPELAYPRHKTWSAHFLGDENNDNRVSDT
jgi:hypothetical protein